MRIVAEAPKEAPLSYLDIRLISKACSGRHLSRMSGEHQSATIPPVEKGPESDLVAEHPDLLPIRDDSAEHAANPSRRVCSITAKHLQEHRGGVSTDNHATRHLDISSDALQVIEHPQKSPGAVFRFHHTLFDP